MKIGEVLAREVMGKDFIESERVAESERRKAVRVTHGFDPRRMVNTVSFTCSFCGQHCGENDERECPHCHAEFIDYEWKMPADIKEAMEKQIAWAVIPENGFACPRCGEFTSEAYCGNCGQRLDWSYVK